MKLFMTVPFMMAGGINRRITMKKLLLATCLMIPGLIYAAENETASPFPNAKKGINIMPMSKIDMPVKMKNEILDNKKSLATKGFDETNSTDQNVISLFRLEKNAAEEVREFDNTKNPYDTHLRSSPAKLTLAFNFNGIPTIENQNILGYAAAGGYVKGKGWDGIVQFVSNKKLGICSYTTYKIERAILDLETTEYLVNKKPSNKSIAGNWNTGFLYTVNWYTDTRMSTLQCANKTFSPEIMTKMIALANTIDKG